MYNQTHAPAALAFTGLGLAYYGLAGFALIGAGLAMLRILPRLSRRSA